MHDNSESPFESTLPELKLPEGGFKSNIPPQLLAGADEQMAWLMHKVSENTMATEFACRAAVEHNKHLRTLNGRTHKNEVAAKDLQKQIDTLSKQVDTVSPVFKPLTQFAALWDYRVFRWIFTLGMLFIICILYPYYLAHPFTEWLASIIKSLGGV